MSGKLGTRKESWEAHWPDGPEVPQVGRQISRQISPGRAPLLAEDPLPPTTPTPSSCAPLLFSEESADLSPSSSGLSLPGAPEKEKGLWAPCQSALPALAWEPGPGRESWGDGGLDIPPAHSLQLHTYLGGISGPGGAPWGQPRKGAPQQGVCMCSQIGCTLSTSSLLTPAPRSRKCRLTHSSSSGRGPTSWKAVKHDNYPSPGSQAADGGGGVVMSICVTVFERWEVLTAI